VGVVDDQNQWNGGSHFADELEGCDRDTVTIGLEVDSQTESGLEGLPLRIGQLGQRPDDRAQELMQAGKSKLGF